jgi:hypothetical protein
LFGGKGSDAQTDLEKSGGAGGRRAGWRPTQAPHGEPASGRASGGGRARLLALPDAEAVLLVDY